MSSWDWIVIFIAKLATKVIHIFKLGSGATWPGEIALRLQPKILQVLSQKAKKVIVVAGTNGKTTTVKMLETILKQNHQSVCHNATGANLDNGLVSLFIKEFTWSGRLKSDVYIFEIDEATLSNVVLDIDPKIVVLLNLFRDQLDRYGEVDVIAQKWRESLQALPQSTMFVVNADDPQLALIGSELKGNVKYFGIEDPKYYLEHIQHATDTIYCPKCGQRLTFGGVYYSHLGKWTCGKCGLTHPDVTISSNDFTSPLEGVYNIYNTMAAALTAIIVDVDRDTIVKGFAQYKPAFGRMEMIIFKDKKIRILLSKNPTGFNESLRTVMQSNLKGPMLIALNDRIPDGTDVSWIWDVDFEMLKEFEQKIFVSGDRCLDMGLRLKYAGLNQNSKIKTQNHNSNIKNEFKIDNILDQAIDDCVDVAQSDQTIWILATYSAMLDARKILTGRKIL